MAGINIIRRWVMSQMTKKSDDGIMITLPDMKKVEINTNITIEKFLQNGINPNAFTNTQQVDNVVNQLNKPKVISQDNPLFKGVMSRMMGKNVIKKDFGPGFKKEVEKMKGKVDDDLPPPGSRGGKDDIAAPVQSAEETLKDMIVAENKKNIAAMKKRKMLDDAIEDASPGFVKGDNKYNAEIVAENLAERMGLVYDDLPTKERLDLYDRAFTGLSKKKDIPEDKTDPVPGKPEWFDALVTKVINQGEDVTKRFGAQEREIVHKLDIDKFEDVMVYRNMDTGEIRVSYESPTNVGEQSVDLVYKKPLPDEGDPRPSAEFYAVEPEPRVVNRDGDMEMDGENLVNSVDELMSDTSKLKMIAKGDAKPTLKEFVTSKRKKDAAKSLNESPMEQAEYIEAKYGPGPEPDFDDIENFASGGIARMLGE
jgi:hypothetical protein